MTTGGSGNHRQEPFGHHPAGVGVTATGTTMPMSSSTEKKRRYSPPPSRTASAVDHFARNGTGTRNVAHYSIGQEFDDEEEEEGGGGEGDDDGENDNDNDDDDDDDYVSHLSGSEGDH